MVDTELHVADHLSGQLIAIRLLIGLFEAGFYPTVLFYLSTFYPRFDLATRIGIFYGQYAVAGAFSGAICEFTKPVHHTFKATKLTSSSLRYLQTSWSSPQLAILVRHRRFHDHIRRPLRPHHAS